MKTLRTLRKIRTSKCWICWGIKPSLLHAYDSVRVERLSFIRLDSILNDRFRSPHSRNHETEKLNEKDSRTNPTANYLTRRFRQSKIRVRSMRLNMQVEVSTLILVHSKKTFIQRSHFLALRVNAGNKSWSLGTVHFPAYLMVGALSCY